MADEHDITLRDVIAHMTHMKQDLSKQIKDGNQELTRRIGSVDSRLDAVEGEIRKINEALQRLYDKRVGLTERVDRIEEQELPAIKAHIGLAT